jgi:hypothetical protein
MPARAPRLYLLIGAIFVVGVATLLIQWVAG